MLSKCSTQYVSNSGRPRSGQRTGKIGTHPNSIRQLHSSPMLVRPYLKSYMLGFSIMLTKSFQMPKLGLEKAEEPEITLPTFPGSYRSKGIPGKHLPCIINYGKAFECMDNNKQGKALKEMRIPVHLTCLLRNLYVGQEAPVRTLYRITDWFKTEKGVGQGCLLSPCLFNLYAEH